MLETPVNQSLVSNTNIQNGCKYSRMYDESREDDVDDMALWQMDYSGNSGASNQQSSTSNHSNRHCVPLKVVTIVLIFMCVLLFLIFSVVWSVFYFERPANYRGHKVYKLMPKCVDDLNGIIKLEHNFKISFWNEPYFKSPSEPILIQITAGEQERQVTDELNKLNVSFTVMIEDLHQAIEEEKMHQKDSNETVFDFSRYHTYEEIMFYIETTLKSNENVNIEIIGKSFEGNKIAVIKVTSVDHISDDSKPVIIIDSLIHSQEWITGATTLYIINDLLTNEEMKRWLQSYEFHIIPVINVDGYRYTWNADRLWKKSRSFSIDSIFCRGVDINRNTDIQFCGQSGESNTPCSQFYCGDYPFSEPEMIAFRDYVTRVNQTHQIKAYFNLHSYKQLILYPYGYTGENAQNYLELQNVSSIAAMAMQSINGNRYRTAPASDTIETSSGIIIDWMYDIIKVKLSFAFHLRDKGNFGYLIPKHSILPAAEEAWHGIKAILNAI